MQREEKQMDMFLENSLLKLTDLKKAISQMIQKIGKFLISALFTFQTHFRFSCRI